MDISAAARSFGSKHGEKTFDKNSDINEDRIINIIDISVIAKEYGKTA